jgi:NADPH2:quinone reductase
MSPERTDRDTGEPRRPPGPDGLPVVGNTHQYIKQPMGFFDELAEDVLAATHGEGVETVLDHRLEEYLETDFQVLAEGGQVVSIMGHVPEANGVPLYNKELTVRGLKMDNHPVRAPILGRLVRLMERDDLTPVVADTYDFTEVDQAHRDILAGGYVGKLVVTP